MRTKKQIIMFYMSTEKYKNAIDMLLLLNINFNGWKNKYIRVSQMAYKKHFVDLLTCCDNCVSSLI